MFFFYVQNIIYFMYYLTNPIVLLRKIVLKVKKFWRIIFYSNESHLIVGTTIQSQKFTILVNLIFKFLQQ